MTENSEAWVPLIASITRTLNANEDTKLRSALRAGAVQHTEARAYPYILPFTGEQVSAQQRTALLRACSLLAQFPELFTIDATIGINSVGQFLAKAIYTAPESSSNTEQVVGQRIEYLHNQDLEEAAATLRRIFSYLQSIGARKRLNAYSLVQLLWYWGNGYTESSLNHRLRVLQDFYSSQELPTAKSTK